MKTWKASVIAVVMLSFSWAGAVHGGDIGQLDTSFGDGGKVVTSFGEFGGQAYAVALQADGKILAAGSYSNGVDLDVAIVRYNEDGSLDTSFSTDGKFRTSLGNGDEELNAIAVQEDGYIVAGGYIVKDSGRDFVLMRLTPDGEMDNSFGEGGVVQTSFGNLNDEITALIIDSEGRIVVCGYVTGTAGTVVALARYKETGELDDTFADGGAVLRDIGDDALARSMDIDQEGRIVLAGSYMHTDRTELMVMRFSGDGNLDTGFGQEGIGLPADRVTPSDGYGVGLMKDGLIMVAGSIGKPGDQDAAVFRFTDAGQPDTTFGDNGVLLTSAGKEDDMALAIDVIDNVVGLSGYNTFNTSRDFLFVSLEETAADKANVALNLKTGGFVTGGGIQYGSVYDLHGQQKQQPADASGTEGAKTVNSVFSTASLSFTDDTSYAVVLQSDGKAVAVGYSEQDGVTSFAVARYITPVANATGAAVDTPVSWIQTREPFEVNRTRAFTGGTIFTSSGLTITQRGVVYSIAPNPVYNEGSGSSGGDNGSGGGGGSNDTTPPIISNSSPTNGTILNSGKTSVLISLQTDETATCRYSTTDETYGSMTDFFDQINATNHTVTVTSLVDGTTYDYYVRCQDLATNVNTTGYLITFSLDTGPVITASSPDNGTVLAAGTPTVDMTVTTDVDAICRYSVTAGTEYDLMIDTFATTGAKDHSVTISLPEVKTYTYYVRCQDSGGTQNGTDYKISFSVAAASVATAVNASTPSTYSVTQAGVPSPPTSSVSTSGLQVVSDGEPESPEQMDARLVVSNGSPSGVLASGSLMAYIGAYSSARATCRYATSPELDFDSMPDTMMTADNISHIGMIIGLEDDHEYSYYVRCRDFDGSENGVPYRISFRVAGNGEYAASAFSLIRDAFGHFLIATAHAQTTDTGTTDTTTSTIDSTTGNSTSGVFNLSAPTYSDEGFTDDGAGTGNYSSILTNLRPGTFYYVRAYALDSNGNVYYGNQVGFKTADSCFIATAAYGSLLHPYVKVLRSFRDRYMITSATGRQLIDLYYHYSPPVADYIAVRPFARAVVRIALLPVVGIGWLVLNIGFAGLALAAVLIIVPSWLVCRSYRRLEIY